MFSNWTFRDWFHLAIAAFVVCTIPFLGGCSSTSKELPLQIDLVHDWGKPASAKSPLQVISKDSPHGEKTTTFADLPALMGHKPFLLVADIGMDPSKCRTEVQDPNAMFSDCGGRNPDNAKISAYWVSHASSVGVPVVGLCIFCSLEDAVDSLSQLPTNPYALVLVDGSAGLGLVGNKEHSLSFVEGTYLVDGDGVIRAMKNGSGHGDGVPSEFNFANAIAPGLKVLTGK